MKQNTSRYNVAGSANAMQAALPVLALVAFWLPMLAPLIHPGMMTRSSDGVVHLLRTFQLDALVRQGVLWPRWSPGMIFGYGYPLFNYYPALSLYPALALHRLGLSLLQSWNLTLALSMLASGCTMYVWVRQMIGRRGAFVAAVAYMLAPYQLYDVYWRGNITESLTLPVLPVVMWAALRVLQERRWRYVVIGALAYAAVFLMHAPASLMLTLLAPTYWAMLVLGSQHRRSTAFRLASSMALGVGLAAFFLIPAYLEKDQVQLSRAIASDWSDFRVHFLSLGEILGVTQPGDFVLVDPSPPRSLGWALGALAATGALVTWLGRTRVGKTFRLHVIWAGAALIGVLAMASPISEPIWLRTPLLSSVLPFIQYPSRFLGVGSLLAALLAGASVGVLENVVVSDRLRTAVAAACGVILAIGAYPWSQARLRPMHDNPDQAFYVAVEKNTGFLGTTTFGEYLPVAVQEIPAFSPMAESMLAGQPVVRWDVPHGRVLQVSDDGLNAELVLESDAPTQVVYRAFYFPGWQASLDGQRVSLKVVVPLGLMAIDVPVGRHVLRVHFGDTPLRTASALVSLLAVIAVAAIAWTDYRSRPAPAMAVPGQPVRPMAWLGLLALGLLLLALRFGVVDRYLPSLHWWHVQPGQSERAFSAPTLSHRVDARLGDAISLVGFDAPERAAPAQQVPVTLVWQALGEINQEYKVFVHLVGADGQLVAQSDAVPAGWTRPTFGWQTGEYVTDVHTLDLAPDVPPGEYRLLAGMYDIGGQRLQTGGGDAIELLKIQIVRK